MASLQIRRMSHVPAAKANGSAPPIDTNNFPHASAAIPTPVPSVSGSNGSVGINAKITIAKHGQKHSVRARPPITKNIKLTELVLRPSSFGGPYGLSGMAHFGRILNRQVPHWPPLKRRRSSGVSVKPPIKFNQRTSAARCASLSDSRNLAFSFRSHPWFIHHPSASPAISTSQNISRRVNCGFIPPPYCT